MRKFEPKHLWPAAILFFAAGCGSSGATSGTSKAAEPIAPATVKPGDEANLFPAVVGNQWTYNAQGTSATTGHSPVEENIEVKFKIAKVDQTADGKSVELEISSGEKVTNRQRWLFTKDGIFLTDTGIVLQPLTPMQPLIKFPVKDGDTYTWTGVGPFGKVEKAKMSSDTVVKGSRLVDTEMGQMSAILVQSNSKVDTGKVKGITEISMWLKPGTGIVRLEQGLGFPGARQLETLRLKSFTPKTQ
jgi:hypothetical protein